MSPRECMSTRPAPPVATVAAIAGSSRSPDTSLMAAAPASSTARATGAFTVSTVITQRRVPPDERLHDGHHTLELDLHRDRLRCGPDGSIRRPRPPRGPTLEQRVGLREGRVHTR